MHKIFTFIVLFLLWLVFSGLFDAFHLSLGILSCGIVTLMISDLLFPSGSRPVAQILSIMSRAPLYFIWLLKEIVLSNAHVLYLAIAPQGIKKVEPSIIHFKTALQSDAAKFVLANSITLTPGTVTIQMKGDELLVHSISRKTTIALEGDMEERIAKLFGEELKT